MKKLLDDKSRFIAILEFLPENFIGDFVNYYLYNAYYPIEFNKILYVYVKYKKELLAEFSNPKIQDAYQQFNKTFDIIEKFTTSHFYIPEAHYKRYKDQPFFYLEPLLHHNFRISEGGESENKEKDSLEWDKYKNELDGYAGDFEEAYKSFLRVAKMEIERDRKEEILKISPELYGIGINLKTLWRRVSEFFGKQNA